MSIAATIVSARAFLAPGRYNAVRLRTEQDKARRLALLIAIAVVHVALIWWLVMNARSAPSKSPEPPRVVALALAPLPAPDPGPPAPAAPPPPSPQPLEEVVDLPQMPSADPLPAPAAAPSQSLAAGGGGCSLAMDIGRAIEADPEAMGALATLTPDLRTAADAIMLWNGNWSRAAVYGGRAAGAGVAEPLRRLAMREIAAAPPECRDGGMIGPQLIPIADRGRTAMLAVGSGSWRWADLLREPVPIGRE